LSLESDIAQLKIQEERLRFKSFDEADAWALGNLMRERAVQKKLPLVMDIQVAGRPLFYTALPGSTPDNSNWVRRKITVVMRLHKCSYRESRDIALSGRPLDELRGFHPIDVATHGGSFPIHIIGTGIVGTVTVSGIPQREDHNFVVACLCEFLKLPLDELALAKEDA
jgi:uncharacterized protein (UPF0303 family)